jgi:protein-S-isoprenylcysteine O-methyltransferase Ste14
LTALGIRKGSAAQTRYDATDMTNSPDNAGVRVPPPLLYALAVLAGYVLNRQWPLAIGEGPAINVLALAFAVAGLALAASSIGNFRRSRTSIVPIRPATTLVISGPYRFTRNPMYVSMAAITIAAGLLLNSWWVMLLLVLVLLIVRVFVIGPEERYLHRRFGADYVAYTHQVRRWV